MTLNLPKRSASREDRCGKFRPIIGLRGTWKNSKLYPWSKYEICKPTPVSVPLTTSFRAQMLKEYEGNMKKFLFKGESKHYFLILMQLIYITERDCFNGTMTCMRALLDKI